MKKFVIATITVVLFSVMTLMSTGCNFISGTKTVDSLDSVKVDTIEMVDSVSIDSAVIDTVLTK